MRSPWGRAAWWVAGACWGPGFTVTAVEGSHVPGSVWPAVVVVCGGWMMGRLEMGMLTLGGGGLGSWCAGGPGSG